LGDIKEDILECLHDYHNVHGYSKQRILDFESAVWFNYNQFYLNPQFSNFYKSLFDLKENFRLLLARGYARDNNIKQILEIMDERRYFILDPAFPKQNDAALLLSGIVWDFSY